MVKRRRLAPFLVGAMLLAGSAGSAACAAVFGFERLTEESVEGSVPENEAASEASVAPVEAGATCPDLGIPDRPPPSDAGASAPLHMAMMLIDFGIDKAASPAGYNLDRACSPTLATSTCKTVIDEATFEKYGKDKGSAGVDSASSGLFGYLSYLGSAFAPESINARLRAGEFGMVLRLANWNGLDEDDEVVVEIFPAIGAWETEGGAPVPGGTPSFSASDQWMRDARFQNILDASRIKSANAWVTGGRLVASFQSVTLPISVPYDPDPLDVIIQEAYASGMLVRDGASWKLSRFVLGGRWATSDLLAQVRSIYIKDTAGLKDVVLCDPGLPFDVYGAVKKEACDARDIRRASRDDGNGLPCDAFSTAVVLDTYAVDQPGDFADRPVLPPRCEKDGSVPVDDDCAPASP